MTLKFNDVTIPIWIYDIDKHHIYWANQPGLELWESDSIEELSSRDFQASTSGAVQESLLEYQKAFLQGETIFHNWHFSPKGIEKHAFCQLSGYPLDDGRMAMLVEALPVSKLNYDMQMGFTVMLSSYLVDGQFLSGNSPFLQAMGRNITRLDDIVIDSSALKTIYRGLSQSGRFENDVLMRSQAGERWYHLIAVNSKARKGIEREKILLHQYDIHQRKTSEIALAQEVLSDALTGLLNRRGLDKKLKELEEIEQPFMLCYIDLDGFKLINDSFGHGTGDHVLQSVAERLLTSLPANSFACRFGGDEFVVGLVLDQQMIDEELFAGSLVSTLSDIYYDELSRPMALSASIGVIQYPTDVDNIMDVVLCADAAMYEAKQSGKRRWVKYKTGMEQAMRRQSMIAQYLYYAQEKAELTLYYQPIWDFSNDPKGKIISFEALLRWHNEELGWVPAEEVVQAAEEIGVIDNIERWVICQALSDLILLRKLVSNRATMSINISAIHLREPKLPEFLLSIIEESQFLPEDLTVELTESTLIDDLDSNDSAVRKLVDNGINISIDDFGTGYSSLAYLHHIPATTVKLDRAFVEHIEDGSKTVQHIHRLIKAHGMRTLIEGVETGKQKQILLSSGINIHQGYLLGEPQPLSFYIENKDDFDQSDDD
ncbi:MAG: putative bifunctional diguanylate cyclase/phosphodiesterase [Cellvibrionaceae bacterium]